MVSCLQFVHDRGLDRSETWIGQERAVAVGSARPIDDSLSPFDQFVVEMDDAAGATDRFCVVVGCDHGSQEWRERFVTRLGRLLAGFGYSETFGMPAPQGVGRVPIPIDGGTGLKTKFLDDSPNHVRHIVGWFVAGYFGGFGDAYGSLRLAESGGFEGYGARDGASLQDIASGLEAAMLGEVVRLEPDARYRDIRLAFQRVFADATNTSVNARRPIDPGSSAADGVLCAVLPQC